MAVLQRATVKPAGSIFIFNFAVANFTKSGVGTHGGDFGFLERIPENRRGVLTGHPLTIHICAVQFVLKRGTHVTRLAKADQAQVTRIAVSSLCAEKNLSYGLIHVSSLLVVDSLAVYHRHIIFLIRSSFNHDTRTRSTTGTT